MAGSVNKVIIVGNLGKDPEIRAFNNGGKVANMTVATSENWKDRNSGERRERTEWHNVSVTGDGLVGICERFLRKGSKVYVEGKLQTRKWQDQSGNDRYSTEVVVSGFGGTINMLDPKGGGRHDDDRQDSNYPTGAPNGGGGFKNDLDGDEIPFAPEFRA